MRTTASFGRLERAVHRVAFATRRAQLGLADLEARWFRAELHAVVPGPPVWVAGLPRAGSTALLELLAACPEFAAQTYRDAPFALTPLLWRALARRVQRPVAPRERAHGDGLEVAPDSPAALEELVWRAFWPAHYRRDRIAPWTDCARPEFVEFFAAHRQKVVALCARTEPRARRYLAKNNATIARVPAILDAVPDATVVVPLRDPVQQAASLLRQHLRFTAIHRDDPFARRYMADLGHFEFGAGLRPIDFGGWLDGGADGRAAPRPDELAFWLDYWLAAHRHLLAHADRDGLVFVDCERLAATRDVGPLAARLGVDARELERAASRLRPLPTRAVDAAGLPASAAAAAAEVHAALRQRALR
ncbi:MAG: sulfotransferase [Planctomycetota bacterium]